MAPKKYDALLIDPDVAARMRLKSVTSSVVEFGQVDYCQSTSEALGKLGGGSIYDVVFVSNRVPDVEVQHFIKNAKESKGGQDAAFVLVLKTGNQGNATVAKNVIGGADGFLMEPFSVDNVMETTSLAAKVKAERSDHRAKAAVGLLVKDIIPQLDQVAYVRSCNMDAVRTLKKLEELCVPIRSLSDDLMATYYEEAINHFSIAPVPKNITKFKKYEGVSSRIKNRMEKKVLAELEAKQAK